MKRLRKYKFASNNQFNIALRKRRVGNKKRLLKQQKALGGVR